VFLVDLCNIGDHFAPMDKKTNLMLANDPISFVIMHANAVTSSDYDREQQFAKVPSMFTNLIRLLP
jgi:hypothetical protein